jgi:hypothetical protein
VVAGSGYWVVEVVHAAIALRQLLPLLPRLRIAGEPEWKPNTVLRGLEHLWLEEAPASVR